MPFSRRTPAHDPSLEASWRKHLARAAEWGKTAVTIVSVLTFSIGLLIHGIVLWRSQYKIEPRIAHLEVLAAKEEVTLANLDKLYYPRLVLDSMQAQHAREEAERDARLGRLEDSLYKIQTALTIIATNKR